MKWAVLLLVVALASSCSGIPKEEAQKQYDQIFGSYQLLVQRHTALIQAIADGQGQAAPSDEMLAALKATADSVAGALQGLPVLTPSATAGGEGGRFRDKVVGYAKMLSGMCSDELPKVLAYLRNPEPSPTERNSIRELTTTMDNVTQQWKAGVEMARDGFRSDFQLNN